MNNPSIIPAITNNGTTINKKTLIADLRFFLKFLKSVPSLIPKEVLIKIAGISNIPWGSSLHNMKIPSSSIE